jgi:hypothetical protein
MSSIIQDIAVSLIALGAAGTVVYRSVKMFASKSSKPACGSCASGCAANTARAGNRTADGRRIIRPLVVDASRSQRA